MLFKEEHGSKWAKRQLMFRGDASFSCKGVVGMGRKAGSPELGE